MKPFGALLPFEEALEIVAKHIKPLDGTESVAVDEAVGRMLAEDIVATHSTPPFDRATMDGYAVRAEDIKGATPENPAVLEMLTAVHAGETTDLVVGNGQCIETATGAMVSNGADTVVQVELTAIKDGKIEVYKELAAGTNISRKASDIQAGSTVLESGIYLDPSKVGVLASQGLETVKVYAKPKVAIMPSGEEVVEQGKELKPGQLYDINSYTILSVVKQNGGEPFRPGILHDNLEDIREKITTALATCDILVFSGGSSVGEKDLIAQVISEKGVILFHGLKIKPGKPTMFAMIDGKPVFGMPGFPTSSMVNAILYLAPALRTLGHLPPVKPETVEAKVTARTAGDKERDQFMTVKVENGEATPVFTQSGAITSIARANGYFRIKAGQTVEKGDTVTVTLL